MIRSMSGLFTALLLLGCASNPVEQIAKDATAVALPMSVGKTVTSGGRSKLNFTRSLNPDCTATGRIAAQVTAPPAHGSITIQNATGYTNYLPNNQLYACNEKQTPGTIAFYLPDDSFVGADTARIDYRFPDGVVQTVTFNIHVK